MFDYDLFKEAEAAVLKRVDIPTYYSYNVDNSVDLHATHVNCPIHDDSTASFRYYEGTDTFHCFGCTRGGNVVVLHKFIMKQEKGEPDDAGAVTYSRALMSMAQMFGIKIPNFLTLDKDSFKAFKLKPVGELAITGAKLTYPNAVAKIEQLMQKLKQADFSKFVKVADMVDKIEYVNVSEAEKTEIYLQLIASL